MNWNALIRKTGRQKAVSLLLVLSLLAGLFLCPTGLRTAGAEEAPDLRVGSLEVPDGLQAGQEVTVTAAVYNTGGGETEAPFEATLYAGDTAVQTQTVSGAVYTGADQVVSFQWTPAAAGTVTLKVAADSGNVVAESGENNNELTKEVTVGEAGPLALVGSAPVKNASVDPAGEISLLFNKPVEIVAEATELTLYGNRNTMNTLSSATNLGNHDGVLQVDETNPCKVLVNINSLLESHRVYGIKLGTNVIKAVGAEEYSTFSTQSSTTSLDWQFNTGPIPRSVTVSGPTRIEKGKTVRFSAAVTDFSGQAITDMPLNWTVDKPELASVDSQGYVAIGDTLGKVTVRATLAGHYSNRAGSASVDIREKFDLKLASRWLYEIPLNYSARGQGIPVLSSDGSVYFMIAYRGLGEASGAGSRLRALGPDGKPKTGFREQVVTVPPVVATVNEKEYILTARDKTFLALDPATGETLWQRELDYNITTAASVGKDGNVYVGCADYRLYALHPDPGLNQSGAEYRWQFDAEGPIQAGGTSLPASNATPPTVDNNGNIYVVAGSWLKVVDGQSGALLWQFRTPDLREIRRQAAVGSDGTVFISASDYVLFGSANASIYALTPPASPGGSPTVKWSMNNLYGLFTSGEKPLVDEEGNVYFSIQQTSSSPYLLTKFAGDGGGGSPLILKEYASSGGFALKGRDGNIYTNTMIYGPESDPLAYYDDYYGNLSYFSYQGFSLGADCTIYRFWVSSGDVVAVEAASLYDVSGSLPHSLQLDSDSIVLRKGQTHRLYPRVLDQNGVVLTTAELDWASSDPAVVAVEDGLLTASPDVTGSAKITVSVRDNPEITSVVNVEVKDSSVPVGMFLIEQRSGYSDLENAAEALDYRVERISGQVGAALPSVCAFVYDQEGNLDRLQPLDWQLADAGIADMLNYQGLSGAYEIRYNASLTGKKAGSTTLTAKLLNHPDIACGIEVEVVDSIYNIKWTLPLDGQWWKKWAWHVMGKNGELFYVNHNILHAVAAEDGSALWETPVGALYGINLGSPVTGPDGTVYVYGTTSTAVVAVNPSDGQVKWKYTGVGDGVKKLLAADDAVYALTEAGRLYKFGPDGKPAWGSPLDPGPGNGGMALSPAGKLYISRQGAVYEIGSGGQESLLYQGPAGASLELKEVAPTGDVILQRAAAGSYTLVSLSPTGAENWVYDGLQGLVEAACPAEGGVYAIYHAGDGNAYFYVLDGNGGLRSAGLLEKGALGSGLQFPYYNGDQKPLPGSNGVVYFTGYWTYAVDAASGRVLRTIQIKDAYSLMTPQSLSVDQEGVLYGTFGEMGLMAIAEDAYYGEQVQLGISGAERVRAGSLAELTVKVKNDLAEDKNVIISAAFAGAGDGGTDALTRLEALLAAGKEQEFNLGVRIPPAGDGEIVVSVRDRAGGEIYASWRRAVGPQD